MKRTIVLLHPGALGDVLLAVPAIRRLGARFPEHERVLLAHPEVSRLLRECGVIEHWMPFDGQGCVGLFGGALPLDAELHLWLKWCEVVVAWTEDRDGALASLFRQYDVPEIRIQSPFSAELHAHHQRDRFLETVGETARDISCESCLVIPSCLVAQGKAYLESKGISCDQPLAIVHPGSGSLHKCVGSEIMALLLQHLQQGGLCPVVVEGPSDHDLVERALGLMVFKPAVFKNLDLSLLAGVLVHAGLYIGHDSGITHLAGLLGVRTIAAFGPTDVRRWAPRGNHVTVVRGAPCVCPTWEDVKQCQDKPCLDVPIEKFLTALEWEHGCRSSKPS